jgi:hypothetical protein
MGTQYQTSRHLREFLKKIKEREEIRSAGVEGLSDRELLRKFYIDIDENKGVSGNNINSEKLYKRSYVKNNFFEKNYGKFARDQSDARKSSEFHRVFEPIGSNSYEENLKLPYLDCFLSRYVYHSFTRWGRKVGQYIGFINE